MFCVENKAAVFFEPENSMSLSGAITMLLERDSIAERITNNGKVLVDTMFERGAIHARMAKKLLSSSE